MILVCATCKRVTGFKFCQPLFAVSHGLCKDCRPGVEDFIRRVFYPDDRAEQGTESDGKEVVTR